MIRLEPGTFEMGSVDSAVPSAWLAAEVPRQVTITLAFYMSETEVTDDAYMTFIDATGYSVQGTLFEGFHEEQLESNSKTSQPFPVAGVSWHDAQAFCRWLSSTEERTYRLPTFEEWEFACRAGSGNRFCFGHDPDALGEYAWYAENSQDEFHRCAQKKANALGLYDMHGNLWEWTATPVPRSMAVESGYSGECAFIKGGNFASSWQACRSAGGWSFLPKTFSPRLKRDAIGARIVCEP